MKTACFSGLGTLFAFLTVGLQAATLVRYDFATNANPSEELANTSSSAVTGSGWLSGGTPSTGASTSSFSFFGRGPSATPGTSYIEFTVSADPTYEISLTGLTYNYHISQSQGPATNYTFETRSSLDGFVSAIPGIYTTNPDTANNSSIANETATFDLSGGTFDGLTNITFRLYVSGDDAPIFNDIARWDNILLEGSASVPVAAPIPEPSVLPLLGFGLMGLAFRRR